ncbi:hypothetical protein ACOTDB_19135, partial [Achromobacter ruhlandii]
SALLRLAVQRLMSSSIFMLIVNSLDYDVSRFSLGHYNAALMRQAAVDGSGVASRRLMLAGDDRRAGRQVRQFEPALANDYSSCLVASRAAVAGTGVSRLAAPRHSRPAFTSAKRA